MPTPITMTVWQVWVGDEWRYAAPDTAAMVAMIAAARAGHVRLVDMQVPYAIRFERRPRHQFKPITRRRLLAAQKAIQRNIENAGLFGHLEAAEQPTPEQRIEAYEVRNYEWDCQVRQFDARHWKEGRQMLRSAPDDLRAQILFGWNVHGCPPTATYFASYVHGRLVRAGVLPADRPLTG